MQLDLLPDRATDPDHAAEVLLAILHDTRLWTTCTDIVAAVLARTGEHWSERDVRRLATRACPRVISGQRGYKHTELATPAEIQRFVDWMESQAREMTYRAEHVRRYAHALVG
jgi:hypothetical protein